MAETKSPDLVPPYNPLLDHRKKGFLLNPRQNCMVFIHTDLWRFNGEPSIGDSTVVVTSEPYEARPPGNDDWDWEQQDTTMHIITTGGEPIRSADADNVVLEGSSEFCNACYSALGYLAGHLKEAGENEAKGNESWVSESQISVVHHYKMMRLCLAAANDCPLCKTLWGRCFDIDWAFSKARMELFWTSEDKDVWDGSRPGDARLTCALYAGNGLPIHETTYLNIFRFQLWQSPDFDHYFEHTFNQQQKLAPAQTQDQSSTRSCRPLALEWLNKCKRKEDGKHSACNITPEQRWQPTRLLDLREVEETGKIRLVSRDTMNTNDDKHLEYITLSHCWGAWGAEELERLTRTNLDSWHLDGIAFDSLSQTLRDAVEVARWFDVRWLWVDCMCIIQDSPEDWDNEAALMCEVYKYALLNVSASDSEDARGGCFKDREPLALQPFKIKMPNMNTTWWATVDERSMFDWVVKAPLSQRAWVYQERQLSRRVLHFTKNEVFWECCAAAPSFASETYPNGSPLCRDFVGQSKISLPQTEQSTLALNPTLSKTWDLVCEEFSTRHVSYPQDKLPALAGLAKEFGNRCPSDAYLAGIWTSNLSHGLLWQVREGDDRPRRSDPSTTEYIAPSWSWMSIDTDIKITQRHNHHSLIDLISSDYHPSTADPYGRIQKASLTLRALVRPITIKTNPSPFEGKAYDLYAGLGVEKEVLLFVEDQTEPANQIGFHCANVQEFRESEDRKDVPDTRSYLCMLVAISQHDKESPRELQGLLLEPIENSTTHFRGAGVISLDGMCALRLRYKDVGDTESDSEELGGLWSAVKPAWGTIFDKDEVPVESSPDGSGPMSLYEFDAEAGGTMLERLMPVEITLV